jgi:hypothetical protein
MSKGHGRIQRRVIEILDYEAGKTLPTSVLAAMVYMSDGELDEFRKLGDREIMFLTIGMDPPKTWQRNAVSRACNQLGRRGKIACYKMKGDNSALWARLPV